MYSVAVTEPQQEKPRDGFKHMPQLDSLRALAVSVVMVEHFVKTQDWVRQQIPWGALGVRLFFVLSGFLITGILVRARSDAERSGRRVSELLKPFFGRRFIRLMPVYYAYLAAIAVMLPISHQYLWAFVLYLQNFLFAIEPRVFEVLLAHFWSLAVEEQFYLTWPFIVLFAPRRSLPVILGGIVLLGPILRAIGLLCGLTGHQIEMMMPAHFDTLGLGGLIAVLGLSSASEQRFGERLVRFGVLVGPPLVVVATLAAHYGAPSAAVLLTELGMGLTFAWVISGAARGFGGVGGKVLESRVLQYLGKISYGIYVYHFNVPGLIRDKIAPRLHLTLPESDWLRLPIYAAVTILISALSWRLMEQPLNRLKRRFEYQRTQSAGAGAEPARQ